MRFLFLIAISNSEVVRVFAHANHVLFARVYVTRVEIVTVPIVNHLSAGNLSPWILAGSQDRLRFTLNSSICAWLLQRNRNDARDNFAAG
jgi:hypothetical protein